MLGSIAERLSDCCLSKYNEDGKYLEYFGGSFMRDNHIHIKSGYEGFIGQFYDAVSGPARLSNIVIDFQYAKNMAAHKDKYVADISDMKNVKDYFAKRFRAKSRKNIRRIIESLEKNNPKIVINDFKDIDLLIELNKNTFKEKSSFNKPFRVEIFHDLIKSAYEKHLLTFIINGEKGAVTFAIKYKDTYIFINSGTNKTKFSDLGTYNIYKNMEKAIELKSKVFDAGLGAGNWKEKWHLEKIPQYIFTK